MPKILMDPGMYHRADGIVKIKSVETMVDSIRDIKDDLMDDGFEEDDVFHFILQKILNAPD